MEGFGAAVEMGRGKGRPRGKQVGSPCPRSPSLGSDAPGLRPSQTISQYGCLSRIPPRKSCRCGLSAPHVGLKGLSIAGTSRIQRKQIGWAGLCLVVFPSYPPPSPRCSSRPYRSVASSGARILTNRITFQPAASKSSPLMLPRTAGCTRIFQSSLNHNPGRRTVTILQ